MLLPIERNQVLRVVRYQIQTMPNMSPTVRQHRHSVHLIRRVTLRVEFPAQIHL